METQKSLRVLCNCCCPNEKLGKDKAKWVCFKKAKPQSFHLWRMGLLKEIPTNYFAFSSKEKKLIKNMWVKKGKKT